ncbi:MAG: DoxX family protein, partial [Actinobacteria bacterium]|nr:DoxX family protein [Actinomycetota bacterium]
PVLTPLAAIGLVAQMALAMQLHMKRKETQTVVMNAMFAALALFVAFGRLSDLG